MVVYKGECARDQNIPEAFTCEVVEGKIQVLFSYHNTQSATRQSSHQEVMEALLLALVEYAAVKVAEKDVFITALAVHVDENDNINEQNKEELGRSEVTRFISRPEFYVSAGVGAFFLGMIAFIMVRRRSKRRETFGILPSSQWRSDDMCYECESGFEDPSFGGEIPVDVNYEIGHGFKEEHQKNSGDQGNFSDVNTGSKDSEVVEWNISQKPFHQGFKRVPLSNLMTASLVDVDSESSKSDVFDDIDNDEWTSSQQSV